MATIDREGSENQNPSYIGDIQNGGSEGYNGVSMVSNTVQQMLSVDWKD